MTGRITRSQTITAIDAKIASESVHIFHSQPIKERSAMIDDLVPDERTRCLIKEIKSRDIPTRLRVRFYRNVHRMSKKTPGNKEAGDVHKGLHSEIFSIGDTVEFRTHTGEVGVAVIIALYQLDPAEDVHEGLPFQWGKVKARLHRFQVAGRARVNMFVQERLYIPVRGTLVLEFLDIHSRTGRNILLSLRRFGPHRSLLHSLQVHCEAQSRRPTRVCPFAHFAHEEDHFQLLAVQVTIPWFPKRPFIPVWWSQQCRRGSTRILHKSIVSPGLQLFLQNELARILRR